MIRVATNMSQVPELIFAVNSTNPPVTATDHLRPVVKPFKSGEETSVKVADDESQTEYT